MLQPPMLSTHLPKRRHFHLQRFVNFSYRHVNKRLLTLDPNRQEHDSTQVQLGETMSLVDLVSHGPAKTCMLAVTKEGWALAWPHRWILPTSKKTKATWPLSEQMELTPALPVLVLSEAQALKTCSVPTLERGLLVSSLDQFSAVIQLRQVPHKKAYSQDSSGYPACLEGLGTSQGLWKAKTPILVTTGSGKG